jgi:AcrR family transcriptional regulator
MDAAGKAADKAERAGLPITRAKKRADRNPERTRAAILAAAEDEFAAKGYDGARLANIAAGAKCQQALIYHYFADKESLYEEVMREGLAATSVKVWDLISVMQTAVSARNGRQKMQREDVRTLVTGFVELLGEFFAEHASLVAMLSFELRKGERAVRFVEERVRPMFESVVTELEKMRDRGELNRKVSPRELAISAVAIVAYPIESKRLVGAVWPSFDPRAPERKAHTVELLCNALLP